MNHPHKHHEPTRKDRVHPLPLTAPPEGMATDPVCGMSVKPATAKHRHEHQGSTYFFCNPRCLEKFRASPATYLEPRPAAPAVEHDATASSAEYTCPMHPEVVQLGPGTCPKCGMALEPKVASAEPAADHELDDMRRRLVVSAAFSIPLFVLAMTNCAGDA